MRFLLFDRITAFEPGKRIGGTKHVSLSDEAFRSHFDHKPVYPATLVLEAMVQLAGWLAIEKSGFEQSVVLSVAEDATLPADLLPGTRLDLVGELLGANPKGAIARASASVDGVEVARVGRVLYASVPNDDPEAARRQFTQCGGPA